MGRDGRVRVIDFGLAIDDRGDDGGRWTRRAGTPRYMSPEQRRGEPLTAAADQYAFAASLREALSWVDRVLDRALADDPVSRFPSMLALDAALGRDPVARWRRRAMAAVPVVVAIAGYAIGLARESGPPPCSGAPAELAAAWTPARRDAAVAHLASIGTPYARLAAARLSATVDAYAARWIEHRRAGCLSHQRGELSTEMYDRHQICLASARTQLAAVLELGGKLRAEQVDSLVGALPELPDLARCDDPGALTAVPLPALAQVSRAAKLRARLDRAGVRMQAGADDVVSELAAIVADARMLGYRPLLADALLAQGTSSLQQWKFSEAEGPFREAQVEALRTRDYRAAVEAFRPPGVGAVEAPRPVAGEGARRARPGRATGRRPAPAGALRASAAPQQHRRDRAGGRRHVARARRVRDRDRAGARGHRPGGHRAQRRAPGPGARHRRSGAERRPVRAADRAARERAGW